MKKRYLLLTFLLFGSFFIYNTNETNPQQIICGKDCYGMWECSVCGCFMDCNGQMYGIAVETPSCGMNGYMMIKDPVFGQVCKICQKDNKEYCEWCIVGCSSIECIDSCADCGAPPSCEEWLIIKCNVGGYKLYIDGEYILTEDGDGECGIQLPPGTYSIKIKKEGCETVSETARIECGYSTTVRMTMECPEEDSDGDGVPDDRDDCYNPGCTKVDSRGCPKDSDGDGINDCEDDCPHDKGPSSNDGCPIRDSDGDGVPDDRDDCYNPGCTIVDSDGCPRDSDGDGINDCEDDCPYDKENYNGYQDNDGCPDTPPTPEPTSPPTPEPISPPTPEPPLSDKIKKRLAEKYAPTLWFHGDEKYRLILPEFFISNSEVDDNENLKLDVDGYHGAIQLQSTYNGIDNPVYFRIDEETYNGKDYIFIQYWFHYLYNYKFNAKTPFDHEGEWEMIVVILEGDESLRNGTSFPLPYMVAYSHHKKLAGGILHKGGKAHKWNNTIVEKELDYHPIIYVANGTHASYFTNNRLDHKWDDTERGFRISYVTLRLLDIEDNIWLEGIKGKWGGDGDSPVGPSKQGFKWDYPVTWAMSLLDSTEFYLGSPAHMLITDNNGKSIGYLGKNFVNEIPDAYAITTDEYEYYHLPRGNYSVVITALDDGEIDFDIIVTDNGEVTYVSYIDKSISHTTKAFTEITSEKKYELNMDQDGDGTIDEIVAPDEIIEYKDERKLYSYLPYILIFLASIILVVMIYRTRTARKYQEVKFETELKTKLQKKLMKGELTQQKFEQKLKDMGLYRNIMQTKLAEKPPPDSIKEVSKKLEEKLEKGEITKAVYLQKIEDLGIIPQDEIQKKLFEKFKSGKIDEKEYARKKRDLEEA